jgi:hypothetical protein
MNTQMHMSPNSHNGTTPSSSSSGHREGTSTFPPPPPPSTPVMRSCPPGPTSTVFSSDDDEEQDRGMASPASHRTTHIEILKDAPGSNTPTLSNHPKARRRSSLSVKRENSSSPSSNCNSPPLHEVRSSSALQPVVQSPSTVVSKYLYKASRTMTLGIRGDHRNVLPFHYSPKRKSRVNTQQFAIFAVALVLLALTRAQWHPLP